ncbi:MAG: sugar ABC transporter substrate-binding protein [Clostridiales bacterium]|nr:sugar ABC transporter substrate-binding protein [Clostridiales bacterium]
MKSKKIFALTMACMMGIGAFAGCAKKKDSITDYTFFACMPGKEINDGNEIQAEIAKLTGVRVKETWITGQEPAEAVGSMVVTGELPDFIDGGDGSDQLYEAGVLVAWDDYLAKDEYKNLKEMYSDKEWDMFRKPDGKIYWANVFQNTYGESKATGHNDEAFWIQVRVLEWAGYPKLETMDDYFGLLERYYAENKTNADGTAIIPYTALCEGWRYFCIENAPQFLDGYPNDGSVIVQLEGVDKPTIVDYNTTPTAKRYFSKLNEIYNKNLMDPDFAAMTYDDYMAKLASGAVLGMCDQWWDFAFTVNDKFKAAGYDELGYNYVPFGLTIEAGMKNHWHTYGDTLNSASGIAVTTKCKNPDKAFTFLARCLDQDIHDLRFWGIKGTDYLVDDQGLYYRTEEMRNNWADADFQAKHCCAYSYFPQYGGTSRDGKNAMNPGEQTSEFFATLADPLVKCFEAYGYTTYGDFLQSEHDEMGFWFPMYSYSNNMSTKTDGGAAWAKMGDCKHEWLPKVVMASDFEATWAEYMDAYNACKPEDFLAEMQVELDRRVEMGKDA